MYCRQKAVASYEPDAIPMLTLKGTRIERGAE